MPKPKPTPRPEPKFIPSGTLTIYVKYDEDFTTFCTSLLQNGYINWWLAHRRSQRPRMPLSAAHPWPVWRKLIAQAARPWWKVNKDDALKRRHPRNIQDRCDRVIGTVIADLAQAAAWPKYSRVPPPWKGRPLSVYRLVNLMEEKDPDLKEDVCKKYARLWFIHQKFDPLTPQDRAFLKQHDPNTYRERYSLPQQSLPRK